MVGGVSFCLFKKNKRGDVVATTPRDTLEEPVIFFNTI
jgi:hypothetical protein